MATDRNKIARSLPAEALRDFVAECAAAVPLTLERVRQLAAARGIEVSLMGAKSFRDTTYERHLASLRAARDLAAQLGEISSGDPGHTIADAAAAALSQDILEAIIDLRAGGGLDPAAAGQLAKAVAALRSGNVQVAALQAKLRAEEERRAAVAEAVRDETKRGGISKESRERIERELGIAL